VPILGSGSTDIARAIRAFIGTALVPPLAAGVPLVELLAALATAPEPEAPPAEPWRPYLPLSIDEFLQAGVTLELWLRLEQLALFCVFRPILIADSGGA